MSKLAAPHFRGASLSWKGVVGDLVPVYYPGHRRKKYASCIIYDIAFRSSSVEADAMEAMWWKI